MRVLAFWRRGTFEYYDERLAKVLQEKLELQKRLSDIEDEEQTLLRKRRDFGIKEYASIKAREKKFLRLKAVDIPHWQLIS